MKKLNCYRNTFIVLLLTSVIAACSTIGTEKQEQVTEGRLFEGIITYEITYEGNESYKSAAFAKMGKVSRYCFRKGNYYQDYDGRELEYNLYLNEPNFYFTKYKGFDTLDVMDCNKEMASKHDIHEIRTTKTHEMVLGKDCQVLTVDYHQDGSFLKNIHFYYNSHVMPINPEWEAHNPVFNSSAVFARTGSLPLKIVYDYGELRIIYTATGIEERDLESFFAETEKAAMKNSHKKMN